MRKNILEDKSFVTGKGYLAAVEISKLKAKPNGNKYNKINGLTTKLPVKDYFISQTGFGSRNFTKKLFRFAKLSVYTLNKKNLTQYAFVTPIKSQVGAVISMSALNSILELSGLKINEIYLFANVSSEPFVVTDELEIPHGLIFPLSQQWINSESFYTNEKIKIIKNHNIYIKIQLPKSNEKSLDDTRPIENLMFL